MKFKRIAILGAGLLGGSIMKTAKKLGVAENCAAWSRSAGTRELCKQCDFIDEIYENPRDAVAGADVVVACVPVDKIAPTLAQVVPAISPDALITDVGSTKRDVCEQVEAILPTNLLPNFVGSHPMAGIELNGILAARDDLFDDHLALITPTKNSVPATIARAENFWKSLGMRTQIVVPAEHDKIIAHVSHLPQAVAVALAGTLAKKPIEWRGFGAGGLRDTTRIAAGTPEVWQAIFKENRAEILPALDAFLANFQQLRDALACGNDDLVLAILKEASAWRIPLSAGTAGTKK